jgi:hypothetical protein
MKLRTKKGGDENEPDQSTISKIFALEAPFKGQIKRKIKEQTS